MRRLCPWKPHVRKSAPDPLLPKIPQYAGIPGWLLLTHNESNQPVAIFVDMKDRPTVVPLVMDERVFSDTVFRVIQLGPSVFLVCDIRYLNGRCVYEQMSYTDRRALVEGILDEFHQTDLTALISYDKVSTTTFVRGWEQYDESPGSVGVFLPADE
jgi:hypothetical protein